MKTDMQEVNEEFLKLMAFIIGPSSAARQALTKFRQIQESGHTARCFVQGSSFVVADIDPKEIQ